MGRKNSCNGKYNGGGEAGDFRQVFNDFKCACNNKFNFFNNGRRRCRPCNPFCITPAKCIVMGILVVTLLFYGVGLYGLIIIGLLLLLLQFV